ncbi:MAG: polysaccharide biosynthesis/export family protein [Sulfitobacter sp.]
MKQAIGLTALAFAALLYTAAGAGAQEYRLLSGDRVTVSYLSQGTSVEVAVDIDGELRLPGAGGVPVAGATLDEAEALVDKAIKDAGVFLNSSVALQMLDYAPITVSGDVTTPGQYRYIPGMTVGAALALSGGSQISGVSRFEVERARIDNEGALRTLNLSIAGSVLRISRLEALVAGAETYSISKALVQRIPQAGIVPLENLQAAESGLFETTRNLAAESIALWEDEINLIEDQLTLFEQRIAVQEEILVNTAEELERAQDLQERGLQTAARLTTVIQRNADAQARALELESARIAAVQAVSEARRRLSNFSRTRREEWLGALQTERLALEDTELNYGRRLEQQAVLTGNLVGSLMLSEVIDPTYAVVSPRDGRQGLSDVGLDTPILPGEMLIVKMAVGEDSPAN